VTLQHLFGQKITRQYPEYKRDLPERSRGMLTVDMDRCIACLQCMRICPDHCISIEQEKRDADGSGKAKPYAVGFVIDDEGLDRADAAREVVRRYQQRSFASTPVHSWPVGG
jgi:NADH-quinone oxidoreductase subunit I